MPGPESTAFQPVTIGPVSLRNRFIKAATFEGMTPDGVVSDDLVAFHRAVAAGGVGMSTVAYLAVAPEGRTHREQIVLADRARPGLERLTAAIHEEGAAASAQIGHAGPVANSRSNGSRGFAPTRRFNPLSLQMLHAPTDSDLARITADFATGAVVAADAGFDAVEVHLGHNYLLSAFLSRSLNKRTDQWGGSLENRARFPRQVLQAVREAVGNRVAVTAKLNMVDGYRGGLAVDESLQVAQMLQDDGALDALELTGGSSLANPMYLFRGDAPRKEFTATLPPWLRLGFKLGGNRFLREYPYEEAYFLPKARQFLATLDLPIILLGGISERATAESAIGEGFTAVAMARALLREPDLVGRWAAGEDARSRCTHCNKCMPTIYTGTHCVLVD